MGLKAPGSNGCLTHQHNQRYADAKKAPPDYESDSARNLNHMTDVTRLDDHRNPPTDTARTSQPSRSGSSIRVACLDDNGETTATLSFAGRDAWALDRLITAGESGCTPITEPGPRWSHYVHMLRRGGLAIETLTERHGGRFKGEHGRYVLRSKVRVIENTFAEGRAA